MLLRRGRKFGKTKIESVSKSIKIRIGAFTLAELIVVISILAILGAIGFISLSGYTNDAQASAMKANVRSVYTAITAESSITGNSPRYYIEHDSLAALTGALIYVDGDAKNLTGGAWNVPGTNYSAGNPDYVKLRLNREKFKVSKSGNAFLKEQTAWGAYDEQYVAVGAMSSTEVLPSGKTRQNSYVQAAGISAETSMVYVVGNLPNVSSGNPIGLVKDPAGTGALIDGQTAGVPLPPPVITVTLAPNASMPLGKLGKPYNNGLGYDMKSLVSVTGDPSYSPAAVTWSLSGSTLPAGLSLGSDGMISGTPTTASTGTVFTVVATYVGKNGERQYTIKVGNAVLTVSKIAPGLTSTCAIEPTGGVKCWGNGRFGHLGNGVTTSTAYAQLTPVTVLDKASGLALTGATALTAGGDHYCVMVDSGLTKCWGESFYGQIGNGGSGYENMATPVMNSAGTGSLLGVVEISASVAHTCARMSDSTMKCWGINAIGSYAGGAIGDGTRTHRVYPVTVLASAGVPLTGVKSISTGHQNTCAILNDDTAMCWGTGTDYQVGDGANGDCKPYPLRVTTSAGGPALAGIAKISNGYRHTCALMISGGMKCWGFSGQGQIGDGTLWQRYVPTDVLVSAGGAPLTGITDISVGSSTTCALMSDQTVKCWGDGTYGSIGDGTATHRSSPTAVLTSLGGPQLTGVAALSINMQNTCALMSDGSSKCWGNGVNGKLGQGTTANSYVPVEVLE